VAISALWTIREEAPALIRYCADDGVGIVSQNIFRSVVVPPLGGSAWGVTE